MRLEVPTRPLKSVIAFISTSLEISKRGSFHNHE